MKFKKIKDGTCIKNGGGAEMCICEYGLDLLTYQILSS